MYTSGGNVSKALSMGGKFTMPEGTMRHMHDVRSSIEQLQSVLELIGRPLKKSSSRHRGLSHPNNPKNLSGSLISRLLLEDASL